MVAMVTNMVSGIKETMKETPKACIPLCVFGPVWAANAIDLSTGTFQIISPPTKVVGIFVKSVCIITKQYTACSTFD